MHLNNQEKAINFAYKHNITCDVESKILDLVSELGILSKKILKVTNYGKENFVTTPEIEDQVGEAYLVFLELANEIGVNLEDSLKRAVERNELKLKDKDIKSKIDNDEKEKNKVKGKSK